MNIYKNQIVWSGYTISEESKTWGLISYHGVSTMVGITVEYAQNIVSISRPVTLDLCLGSLVQRLQNMSHLSTPEEVDNFKRDILKEIRRVFENL